MQKLMFCLVFIIVSFALANDTHGENQHTKSKTEGDKSFIGKIKHGFRKMTESVKGVWHKTFPGKKADKHAEHTKVTEKADSEKTQDKVDKHIKKDGDEIDSKIDTKTSSKQEADKSENV
uniref:Uncharacterized protein n=1 Tax=Ditylenchus dipsaci TaxID=166011 RepID=A0A915EDS3_9BILA